MRLLPHLLLKGYNTSVNMPTDLDVGCDLSLSLRRKPHLQSGCQPQEESILLKPQQPPHIQMLILLAKCRLVFSGMNPVNTPDRTSVHFPKRFQVLLLNSNSKLRAAPRTLQCLCFRKSLQASLENRWVVFFCCTRVKSVHPAYASPTFCLGL